MPEQHWRDAFKAAIEERAHSAVQAGDLIRALQPHLEAAYARGLMAGRSQAGYDKRKEKPCAPSVEPPTRASSTDGEP